MVRHHLLLGFALAAVLCLSAISAPAEEVIETWRNPLGHMCSASVNSADGSSAKVVRQPRSGRAGVAPTEEPVYQWYWGDMHAHSEYSDGVWLPEEVYEFARDTAQLDFFALTDHDAYPTIRTQEEYDYIVARADEYDAPGNFVALYGVEWTHEAGHLNFYMSPIPQLPYDLDGCYAALADLGILGHFNHPNEPDFGNFDDYRYVPEADACMAMVEVRSDWWTDEEVSYLALLEAGWHVAPVGCEDKHDASWGMGPTWTVALASELTREGILDALWSRRVYSTADRNMQLSFKISGREMGSRLRRPAGPAVCMVRVSDPDATDFVARLDLFVDGQLAASAEPGATSYEWSVPVELPAGGEHYCFVRVTQEGARRSWSSPIWITTYADIGLDFWAYDEIMACSEAGIVGGYEDGLYHPERSVTRGQMAVFVARGLAGGDEYVPDFTGTPTFPDVDAEHWALDYVEYVVEQNIVGGFEDGTYRPTEEVTRDQMAVFVARAMVAPNASVLDSYVPAAPRDFPDVTTDHWAYTYVEYCVEQGVVGGYLDGTYRPDTVVTRDQMAVYVARAFDLVT
jgi:hypothetical protein